MRGGLGRRPRQGRLPPRPVPPVPSTLRQKNENKAIFALAHTLIVIIWHVLAEGCDYAELGGDYFDKRNSAAARQQYLVRELQKLGHIVTLQPAA